MPESKQPAAEMMFKDLTEEVQRHLIDLSVNGYIYIGRTGCGLSGNFRRQTLQQGTFKVIEEDKRWIGEVKAKILQLIAVEAPDGFLSSASRTSITG